MQNLQKGTAMNEKLTHKQTLFVAVAVVLMVITVFVVLRHAAEIDGWTMDKPHTLKVVEISTGTVLMSRTFPSEEACHKVIPMYKAQREPGKWDIGCMGE